MIWKVCSCVAATAPARPPPPGRTGILEAQREAPPPTPAPGSEPERMAGPTTTCDVVTVPAQDCAAHRPSFAPCGRDCLASAVSEIGCGMDDFLCQCASDKQAALSTLVLPCVRESCQDQSVVSVAWDAAASKSISLVPEPPLCLVEVTER